MVMEVEILINAIQERPILWDKRDKNYHNRLLSYREWEDLAKISGTTRRPTVTPTNKSITAVYGQPLTLTMEFCANPPYTKVLWIAKNQKVYKPGDADKTVIAYGITNSTTANCHQAVLFLTKVTTIDTGEYNFIVRSPNGLAEGSFFVNMTYASGYHVPQYEVTESSSGNSRMIISTIYINVILLLLNNC